MSGLPVWTVEDWSDQTSQSKKQLGYCGEVSLNGYWKLDSKPIMKDEREKKTRPYAYFLFDVVSYLRILTEMYYKQLLVVASYGETTSQSESSIRNLLTNETPLLRISRRGEGEEGEAPGVAVSCPGQARDCDCSSCLLSLVQRNKLIFLRKYSDPSPRAEVPR